MEEHLFRHISSPGHNGFSKDLLITFIDKTDPSDPLKRVDYWRRTLRTMASFGLNIEDSICSIIMVINDSLIINNYLTFRSRYGLGLF